MSLFLFWGAPTGRLCFVFQHSSGNKIRSTNHTETGKRSFGKQMAVKVLYFLQNNFGCAGSKKCAPGCKHFCAGARLHSLEGMLVVTI